MAIWNPEIKELEKLYDSIKGQFPELEKELERLIRADDENMILLYSRRSLEVIIADLCKCELKRDRGTEPLKGIIDKLHKEKKIPPNIIASIHSLNELSTFGTHPKDFDPEQIKPVLNNLNIIIKWYVKYKNLQINGKTEEVKSESKPQTVSPPEKSIIVLPFENMSPDPDQEYFSDGLTEEIITDLSHIQNLLVISRSSAMTFKGTKKTIPEIAQAVKVRFVLEGSVRKAGKNLRITAQLIDSITDTHLWAEKYTGILDDVFDIQEKVSQCIAKALKIKLSLEEEQKIHERFIDNAIAYDYYLKAKGEIMTFSKERIENGSILLHKGMDIIGKNPIIYSALASVHFMLANIGVEQELNITKAEEYAGKALEINPKTAEAHLVLANLNFNLFGRTHQAIFHFNKAHVNKPEDPEIMIWLALLYIEIGKSDAARYLVEKCIKIDPLNPWNRGMKGCLLFFLGEFNVSLTYILELFQATLENGMTKFWKSLILLYNNRPEEAYDFIEKVIEEPGQDTLDKLTIFIKYVIKGDKEKLSSLLTTDFVKALKSDLQLSSHVAALYSYLGDKEKSLEYLENAVNHGFINYHFLNEYDPLLKNIRGEERFKKLMKRVKYEWENFEV